MLDKTPQEKTPMTGNFNRSIEMLRKAGLRPTQQRMGLIKILFESGNRHITAEELHGEAMKMRIPVSLATVYNTLNQLVDIGLLREVPSAGQKSFFDTNTLEHHHFWVKDNETLIDIPKEEIMFSNLPQPPAGMEVDRVEVTIHLKKAAS